MEQSHNSYAVNEINSVIDELLISESVKSEQYANENYHEEDVDKKGLSTRLKANTLAIEKELTFKDVAMEYKRIGGFEVKDSAETTIALFANYLDKNYNCPTRKI